MHRTAKITLKYITAVKRRKIDALLQAYRAAVNFYIRSLWCKRGKLDKATLERLPRDHTRLLYDQRTCALRQALSIIISTRKAASAIGGPCSMPVFRGAATLNTHVVSIEHGRGSFDFVIRLASLQARKRIAIPTKRTVVLNKWLSKPGARLLPGFRLADDWIMLTVEIPDAEPKELDEGDIIGVDIGVNKLLADSDGNFYGTDFKPLRDKILRKKPRSKAKRRALKERDDFVNRTINALAWSDLSVIGVEALKNLKSGKRKGQGKTFRKAMAPWTYRQVITRIEQKAEENRVRLIRVDPRNTSRTCPECGAVSKDSRRGEDFLCVSCGHAGDADTIGAQNVLARTLAALGSVSPPGLKRSIVRTVNH